MDRERQTAIETLQQALKELKVVDFWRIDADEIGDTITLRRDDRCSVHIHVADLNMWADFEDECPGVLRSNVQHRLYYAG